MLPLGPRLTALPRAVAAPWNRLLVLFPCQLDQSGSLICFQMATNREIEAHPAQPLTLAGTLRSGFLPHLEWRRSRSSPIGPGPSTHPFDRGTLLFMESEGRKPPTAYRSEELFLAKIHLSSDVAFVACELDQTALGARAPQESFPHR